MLRAGGAAGWQLLMPAPAPAPCPARRYGRYHEGRTRLQAMTAAWVDAAAKVCLGGAVQRAWGLPSGWEAAGQAPQLRAACLVPSPVLTPPPPPPRRRCPLMAAPTQARPMPPHSASARTACTCSGAPRAGRGLRWRLLPLDTRRQGGLPAPPRPALFSGLHAALPPPPPATRSLLHGCAMQFLRSDWELANLVEHDEQRLPAWVRCPGAVRCLCVACCCALPRSVPMHHSTTGPSFPNHPCRTRATARPSSPPCSTTSCCAPGLTPARRHAPPAALPAADPSCPAPVCIPLLPWPAGSPSRDVPPLRCAALQCCIHHPCGGRPQRRRNGAAAGPRRPGRAGGRALRRREVGADAGRVLEGRWPPHPAAATDHAPLHAPALQGRLQRVQTYSRDTVSGVRPRLLVFLARKCRPRPRLGARVGRARTRPVATSSPAPLQRKLVRNLKEIERSALHK